MINKNALIELFRFIFASVVLLFHAGADANILDKIFWEQKEIKISFFKYGYLGVEFFFVISGYLMAKTAYRKIKSVDDSTINIGLETAYFLYHKINSFIYVYFISCLMVSIYFLSSGKDLLFILQRIPSILLLQRTGIAEKELIGMAWYLSSMMIGMAIIYPILRKHYDIFTLYIGPLLGILIIGYLIHTTNYLGGVSDWIGFSYKCNFRALAELSLGTTCFEISRELKTKNIKPIWRIFFTIATIFIVIVIFMSICSITRIFNDGIVLLLICFLVVALFGQIGIFAHNKFLYSNKFFCFMGTLSMPIFLFQNIFHYWIPVIYHGTSIIVRLLLIYFATIIFSIIVNHVLQKIQRYS